MTRKALGKGLSALLRETPLPIPPPNPAQTQAGIPQEPVSSEPHHLEPQRSGLREIPLEKVRASAFQPRVQFEDQALAELAQSIRTGGVLQPIIVRPASGGFELVAGERRVRAARLAGMSLVPALVRVLSDEQAIELSLVENIQREDLNPVEQARAFDRLSSEFGLTQDEIAQRTGKDRTTVANTMRLLRLPQEVLVMVEDGRLTAGHARALLKLEDSPVLQRVLAKRMASRRVSVRQAEEMVDRRLPGAKRQRVLEPPRDPNVRAAEETMERALGTKVRVVELKGGRGRVEIDYYTLEGLDRIYYKLVGEAR